MANMDNLFADSIAKIDNRSEREILGLQNAIKDHKKETKELKAKVQERISIARTLVACDIMTVDAVESFVIHERSWSNYNKLDVTGKLSKVRTLFGSEFIELDNESKQVESETDETIRIYLKQCDTYKGPRMYVVTKLPEDSKCKFKMIEQPASSYKRLVCDTESAE